MRAIQMFDGSAAGVIWEGTHWYWLWFAPSPEGKHMAVVERTRWVDEEFYMSQEASR